MFYASQLHPLPTSKKIQANFVAVLRANEEVMKALPRDTALQAYFFGSQLDLGGQRVPLPVDAPLDVHPTPLPPASTPCTLDIEPGRCLSPRTFVE